MRRIPFALPISLVLCFNIIGDSYCAMTYDQMVKSMDTLRNLCTSKYKLSKEQLDGLRFGTAFDEDKDVKCYSLCTAQMAGVTTKKNELNFDKVIKQIEVMLQPDIRQKAIDAATACRDVQKKYKDPCEKVFYSAKCQAEIMGKDFLFP